jgi:tetratricopeptide (TPR) repeat protein
MAGKRTIEPKNPVAPPPKKSKPRAMPVAEVDHLFETHKYAEALKAYETILDRHSNDQNAFYKKAVCQWNLGQVEQSIECLNHYLMIYPKDAKAWAKRGAICIQQHQYPQALQDLRKSMELDSSEVFLEFHIVGACYESFRKVVTSAPYHLRHPAPSISDKDVHLLRGIFFAAHQEFSSAFKELAKAHQIPPDNLASQISNMIQQRSKRQKDTSEAKKTLLSTGWLPISSLIDP